MDAVYAENHDDHQGGDADHDHHGGKAWDGCALKGLGGWKTECSRQSGITMWPR